MAYKIRLRSPTGGATCDVNPDWTMGQLKSHIAGLVNVPMHKQRLLVRFPPVELPFGSDTIIRNLIANGDTITVDVKTDAELEIAAQNEKNFPIRDSWIAETQKGVTAPDFTKVEVVVRKIADDNSCLFNAVGYLLENRSRTSGARIRREVANFIEKNPDLYSDAVLGRKAAEYVQWISNPNSWGGEIEITVLSELYQTKIGVINIGISRLHIYGDKKDYPRLVWLLYDGIHYDAIALSPLEPGKVSNATDESKDITFFDPKDEVWKQKIQAFGETLHDKGRYTDTSTFKVLCKDCGATISGELAVAKHARDTRHTNFVEWKK